MSTSETPPKGFLRSLFTAAVPGAVAGAAFMLGASPIAVAASTIVAAAGDLPDVATALAAAVFPEDSPLLR